MFDLPSFNPTTPLGNVIAKILNYIRSITLLPSPDFIMKQGANGFHLELAPHLKQFPSNYLTYQREYEPNNGFQEGDIAYALEDTNYVIDGEDEPLPVTPGLWVCVRNVPAPALSGKLIEAGHADSPFVRFAGVKYYPFWDPDLPYFEDVADSEDAFTRANTRYWDYWSGLPQLKRECIDNIVTEIYVDSFPSGSAST